MTPVEQQLQLLRQQPHCAAASSQPLPSGANLIRIPEYPLPDGWNVAQATILFVTPPGYPGAQPDCFWLEPSGMRLANGVTPQNSSDGNPIPELNLQATWFSWHLQAWDPNKDDLVRYLRAILQRLNPPR
jgi:Prokaryotic E2 family E